MLVQLNATEIRKCSQAAAARWQVARASGVVNQRKDGTRSDADVDLLGIKGELAVAKIFGIESYSISELGIDCGYDMEIGRVTIDVKATFSGHGHLAFKTLESFKAVTSILVTATEDSDIMNVVGHCPRDEFMRKCKLTQLGSGSAYAVRQDELMPLENLWSVAMSMKFGPVRRRDAAPPSSSMEPLTPAAPEADWP